MVCYTGKISATLLGRDHSDFKPKPVTVFVVPDSGRRRSVSKPELRYSFSNLAANTAPLAGLHKAFVNRYCWNIDGQDAATCVRRTYPQRTATLILEDPIGLEDYRLSIPPQTDETLLRDELKNTDPEKIRAFYAHYFAHPSANIYGPLAEVQTRVAQSGEFPRWAKASALAYQMIYEQPVVYDYRMLQPPTLLIVGQEDHVAPLSTYASQDVRGTLGHVAELAQRVIKDVPNGTLIVIPDVGHIPHLEQPDRFHEEVLNFIAKHPASQNP